LYGFKLAKTCPYFQVSDLVVGETTCDGKKKVYELLNELISTCVIEIPTNLIPKQAKRFGIKK